MTEEIKRIMKYDDRRKILTVKSTEEREAKIGEVSGGKIKFLNEAEYNEEGIKMIITNARNTKENANKTIPLFNERITELEEDLKKAGEITMTPELETLKKNLESLKTIMETIEPKKKELENLKSMKENAEKNRDDAQRDIEEIKNKIGSRLNL